MRIVLLLFLLLVNYYNAFGREITGIIKDSISNEPVAFATIYVNGTTIGTTSDLAGSFKLSFEMEECQIIIDHISYESVVINFNQNTLLHLNIKLYPKNIQIPQVTVEDFNRRSANMEYFKKIFLGNDEWGENAVIENDSVIFFNIEYFDEQSGDLNPDEKNIYFEVITTAPLQIYLPELGYNLEYDLVEFNEAFNPDIGKKTIKTLGYSYFKKIEPISRRDERRIRKNRLKAYYNTSMHFVRSLYSQTLKDNGYKIFQRIKADSTIEISDFMSQDCASYGLNEAYITGLKGKIFTVNYYASWSLPFNFNKPREPITSISQSRFYIVADTCTIRKNGSLPGGEIIFEGNLVKKRMGAALPYDIEF